MRHPITVCHSSRSCSAFGRLVTWSPASLSVDNVLPSGRVIGSSKGRLYCPSRGCISRRTNPVVLRRRFLLQLGQPCADIPTPGNFEGSVSKTAPPGDHTPLGGVVRPPTNFPHLIKLREG